jgi:hypothetical protein
MTSHYVYSATEPNDKPLSPVRLPAHSALIRAAAGLALASLAGSAQVPGQTGADQPRLTMGIEERIRSDDWNNAIDMSNRTDDQRDQVRDRTRLWFLAPLTSSIDVTAGAAMENIQRFGTPSHFDEVYFDQANINFRKVLVNGLSLRIGRQDIVKGEGFIIFDGTPGDGPRSGYFNAADLNYSFRKSRLDMIGILDPASDRFLPRFHDQHRVLQDWDEQAVGAYFTTADHLGTVIDAYYFFKKEVHCILPASNPQFQPDRHVHTSGARITQKLAPRTDLVAEYARQWGAQHGGAVISAWGGYSYVKHTFDRAYKPYVKVGYWAMSGDNPNTKGRIEGWDPLFSQFPKWSDMYVYSLSKETLIAYWSNLRMSQAEAGFIPFRKNNLAFIWYHMDSFHPFAGSPATFGTGTHRGENFQVRWEYSPIPGWKCYIHFENHHPGDFYSSNRSPAYEVQAQVTYQFLFHPLNPHSN